LIHPVRVPGSQQPGHHAIYGIAGMVFSASAIVVKRMAAEVPQSRVISREQQQHRTAAVSFCPDNDTATGYLLCLPCNRPKHTK